MSATRAALSPLPGREGCLKSDRLMTVRFSTWVGAAEALGGLLRDCPEYTLRIFVQLIVPNAQDRPGFLLKKCVPPPVAFRLSVLSSVQLDDQLRLPAREVGEIGSDRELARELWPQPRDHAPELALMPRCVGAEFACALGLIGGNAAVHASSLEPRRASRTHPQPLPSREGSRGYFPRFLRWLARSRTADSSSGWSRPRRRATS